MEKLIEYLTEHTLRGACTCGQCADAGPNPETNQPAGHTADLVFFKVAANPTAATPATAEDLKAALIAVGPNGAFGDCDLLDGQEHGYIEIGGWIGDQGLALRLMGLGAIVQPPLWQLITPYTLLGAGADKETVNRMAASGLLSILAKK